MFIFVYFIISSFSEEKLFILGNGTDVQNFSMFQPIWKEESKTLLES